MTLAGRSLSLGIGSLGFHVHGHRVAAPAARSGRVRAPAPRADGDATRVRGRGVGHFARVLSMTVVDKPPVLATKSGAGSTPVVSIYTPQTSSHSSISEPVTAGSRVPCVQGW